MNASGSAPDFVGIGAQKAATSWLHQCLEEHPALCLPRGKETHYFSTAFARGQAWFAEQFAGCSRQQLLGEISTSYLASREAPARMHAKNPDMKLLVALRKPIARSLSHIAHWQSKGALPALCSAQEAVARFPDIIENSRYATHLKRYFELFPREQVHIVWYDDIEAKPRDVIRGVYAFLGVDSSFMPSVIEARFNTRATRRSKLFWLVNRAYLRARRSAVGRALIRLARFVGLRGRHVEALGARLSGSAREAPRPEDRAFLYEELRGEIDELEAMLGRDLAHWR